MIQVKVAALVALLAFVGFQLCIGQNLTTTTTTTAAPPPGNASTPTNSTAPQPSNSTVPQPSNSTVPTNGTSGTNTTGVWERTNLTGVICLENDHTSINYCQQNFSTLVNAQFHADKKVNVRPGKCLYLTQGNPTGGPDDKKVNRCVLKGTYVPNPADNTTDEIRLHFFNPVPNSSEILVVGYWGKANLPEGVVETPLPI